MCPTCVCCFECGCIIDSPACISANDKLGFRRRFSINPCGAACGACGPICGGTTGGACGSRLSVPGICGGLKIGANPLLCKRKSAKLICGAAILGLLKTQ